MEKIIKTFFDEWCQEKRGSTCRANELYEAFHAWLQGMGALDIPSRKRFFRQVPAKFLKVKIAGAVVYRELCLRPAAVG